MMGATYNLLAIDPGSEKSAFLWCRVVPPAEWALPYGVMPQRLRKITNEHGWENGSGWPHDLECAVDDAGFRVFSIACEVLPGLFGGTSGADQLAADQWAHMFVGAAGTSRCARLMREKVRLSGGGETEGWRVYRSTARSVVTGRSNVGDPEVKAALVDIYGGKAQAIGGGRCRTCKKPEGWVGRDHAPCPNCNADGGGHGDTGFEHPRGVLHGWSESHEFAALAVAIVAAQRIGIIEEMR